MLVKYFEGSFSGIFGGAGGCTGKPSSPNPNPSFSPSLSLLSEPFPSLLSLIPLLLEALAESAEVFESAAASGFVPCRTTSAAALLPFLSVVSFASVSAHCGSATVGSIQIPVFEDGKLSIPPLPEPVAVAVAVPAPAPAPAPVATSLFAPEPVPRALPSRKPDSLIGVGAPLML